MAKKPQFVQAPDGSWHPVAPQAPPAKKSSNAGGCLVVILLAIGAVVVFGAISSGAKNGTSSSAPGTTVSEAASKSGLACRHFRNVAADVRDGILTGAELRAKLKEVDDNAIIATPEVQLASKAMLREATSGDVAAMVVASGRMADACTAAGH